MWNTWCFFSLDDPSDNGSRGSSASGQPLHAAPASDGGDIFEPDTFSGDHVFKIYVNTCVEQGSICTHTVSYDVLCHKNRPAFCLICCIYMQPEPLMWEQSTNNATPEEDA